MQSADNSVGELRFVVLEVVSGCHASFDKKIFHNRNRSVHSAHTHTHPHPHMHALTALLFMCVYDEQ